MVGIAARTVGAPPPSGTSKALTVGLIGWNLGLIIAAVSWFAALAVPLMLGILALEYLIRATASNLAPEQRHRLRLWTYSVLFVHLAIGAAITYIPQARAYLGPDAITYHRGAVRLVEYWQGTGSAQFLYRGKEGFFYSLAVLYRLFGPYPISGLVLNATFGAALVPVLSAITIKLFGEQAGRYVPPLLQFLPAFAIWPSQLLREAGVLFLLSFALYAGVQLLDRFRPGWIAIGSVALAVLFTFRGFMAMIMAATLLAAITLGHRNLAHGLSSTMAVVSALALLVLGVGLGLSGFQSAASSNLETLTTFHRDTSAQAGAGSGFNATTGPAGPGTVAQLPLALARLALGPFPWEVGPRQLPGLVDAMALWVLIPSLVRGFSKGRALAGRKLLILILPSSVMAVVLALAVGNYGLLLRERTQVVLLLIPLFALGLALRAERLKSAREEDAVSRRTRYSPATS